MPNNSLVYFIDGKLIAESGDVRVYKMDSSLYLELGPQHTLWATSTEIEDYIWQLNDRPRGDCLEVGLGLGTASKYILNCPKVNTLTTVEKNKDIINVQKRVNPTGIEWDYYIPRRHTIIEDDLLIYPYIANKVFDFVFINCYDRIDGETLPFIEDLVNSYKRVLRKSGELMCWFDKRTPEEFVADFYRIYK